MPTEPYYRPDLARIHHEGFGFHADAVAPGILALLEPVRERGGLVLEVGCGSGLLTRYLVDAGHRVLATDASPAMLELAAANVPEASVERLRLPDDPVPSADAIVSVGHPLSYLDDEAQLVRAVAALADALRPGGVIAFDLCDLEWGAARREQGPQVWSGDDWVLVNRVSVPDDVTFRREMTTFVRAGELWRRDDETHDNVLVDTTTIPPVLAAHGVDAEVRSSFGDETLPVGLVAVVGRCPATPGDEAVESMRGAQRVPPAPRTSAMHTEWESPEVAQATRATLGGCVKVALIVCAALLLLSYLLAVAIDVL